MIQHTISVLKPFLVKDYNLFIKCYNIILQYIFENIFFSDFPEKSKFPVAGNRYLHINRRISIPDNMVHIILVLTLTYVLFKLYQIVCKLTKLVNNCVYFVGVCASLVLCLIVVCWVVTSIAYISCIYHTTLSKVDIVCRWE